MIEEVKERMLKHYVELGMIPGWKKYVWDIIQTFDVHFPGLKNEFLVKIKEKKNEVSNMQCADRRKTDQESG